MLLGLTRQAQRVNHEAVEYLNLLLSVNFIWKWGETFYKLQFFTFGPKQCFYLTHSARGYFEKFTLKKKVTLNGCISKPRPNSQSKLIFAEISLNFLQNKIIFFMLYPCRYTVGGSTPCNLRFLCCQQVVGLKELMMSQWNIWICSFLSISFGNEEKLSKNLIFSLLDQSYAFT